jgi:hypothetical protein
LVGLIALPMLRWVRISSTLGAVRLAVSSMPAIRPRAMALVARKALAGSASGMSEA